VASRLCIKLVLPGPGHVTCSRAVTYCRCNWFVWVVVLCFFWMGSEFIHGWKNIGDKSLVTTLVRTEPWKLEWCYFERALYIVYSFQVLPVMACDSVSNGGGLPGFGQGWKRPEGQGPGPELPSNLTQTVVPYYSSCIFSCNWVYELRSYHDMINMLIVPN